MSVLGKEDTIALRAAHPFALTSERVEVWGFGTLVQGI